MSSWQETRASPGDNHQNIVELLVVARWEPKRRRRSLDQANMMLERLWHLFRLARGAEIMSPSGFESAMRGLDETGRMLGGWRKAVAASIDARRGRRGTRR